jgi:outer membrane receptor protein involved in Fe transport
LAILRSHGHIRYQTPGGLDLSLHGGLVSGDLMIYLFMGDTNLKDMWMPWVMSQANFAANENLQLKGQLYFHYLAGDVFPRADLRAYNMWIADLPILSWKSSTVDGQFHLEWKVVEGLLFTVGGNLRYSTLAGENFILDNDDELRGAGVAHLEVNPWDFFMLTLGMRLDVSELTGLAPSPRVVVIIRPWPNQAFRLGYGLAFRKPSFLESRVHFNIENYNSSMPEIKDKLAKEFSNPDLKNVDTQSIELGWRGSFLDAHLWLSIETFFNTYRKTISFDAEIPLRLGLPNLRDGYLMFINDEYDYTIIGGEAEISYKPSASWSFTCNVGVRSAEYTSDKEGTNREPALRANLGARFSQSEGILADAFLHFTSYYQQVMLDPEDILRSVPLRGDMGEHLLLVGRLAYRIKRRWFSFETGLTVRAPLLENRWEFPGLPIPPRLAGDSNSDFGGEVVLRQLSVYLRGSF